MKKIIAAAISGMFLSINLFSQPANEKIAVLIDQRDYFELSRQYPLVKNDLGPVVDLLSRALLADAFNKPQEAVQTADLLIKDHHSELGLENIMGLIMMKSSNLFRTGLYADADAVLNQITGNPDVVKTISPETLSSFMELKKKTSALKNYPPPSVRRTEPTCEISYTEGPVWLPRTEATINGKKENFILDTGADCPLFISEKFANEHSISIIADSIEFSGSRGTIYAKMGFAESLNIGNIEFKNIWCLVSDALEINPETDPANHIHAIIGRQLLEMAGEFSFYPKKDKIVFNEKLSTAVPNIALYNGQPYIEAVAGEKNLLFHLDSGGETSLTGKYFEKNKDEIVSSFVSDTVKNKIPWIKPVEGYQMPALVLSVAGKSKTIKDIRIYKNVNPAESGDGVLGMDFLNKFDKVTINFREMFIELN